MVPAAATFPGIRADVCVVGASAGGVQALQTMLARLPADHPGCVLVVLHLAPDGPSQLAEILARRTGLRSARRGKGTPGGGDRLHRPARPAPAGGGRRPAVLEDFAAGPLQPAVGRPPFPVGRPALRAAGDRRRPDRRRRRRGRRRPGDQGGRRPGGRRTATVAMSTGMPASAVRTGCDRRRRPARPDLRNPDGPGEGREAAVTEPEVNGNNAVDEQFEALLHYLHRSRRLRLHRLQAASLDRRIRKRMDGSGWTATTTTSTTWRSTRTSSPRSSTRILINVTGFFRDPPAWEYLRERGPARAARAAGDRASRSACGAPAAPRARRRTRGDGAAEALGRARRSASG